MKKGNAIDSKMSKKKLYLDSNHAESIKKEITKQLDVLDHSFNQMSNLLNKASYKRMFQDNVNSVAIKTSKKSMTLSQTANSINNDIKYKYNDDFKMSLINSLNERISYLESRISK